MSSSYSGPQLNRPYYQLPPVTTSTPQASRPESILSPWSVSSQSSADHLSLTLPPLFPGDFVEVPSSFHALQSPRIHPFEPPVTALQPTHSPSPPPHSRRQGDLYAVPDSDSPLFLNFENSSQPQSPRSPIPRGSNVVDLTESSPVIMAPSSRKRKPAAEEAQASVKRRQASPPRESQNTLENSPLNTPSTNVEELDMVNIDDDQKLEEFRAKQQEDLIKQQNQEKANKPIKLTDFQCIICLDSPTDLTVTHCGKSVILHIAFMIC